MAEEVKTSKALIIYDNSGKILAVYHGDDSEEPVGIPFMWVDLPENAIVSSIDMETGLPDIKYMPDSIYALFEAKMNRAMAKMDEIEDSSARNYAVNEEHIASAAGDLVDVQLAVTELYELMLGGEI